MSDPCDIAVIHVAVEKWRVTEMKLDAYKAECKRLSKLLQKSVDFYYLDSYLTIEIREALQSHEQFLKEME